MVVDVGIGRRRTVMVGGDARFGMPEMVVVPLGMKRGMCVWERTKAIHLRCFAGSEWLLTVENGG